MQRYLYQDMHQDANEKIILLSGPRQVGKTTLSKSLFLESAYLNYDLSEAREAIINKHWRRDVDCVIFDELHKMKNWKQWLKGIYDTEGIHPRLIVTGSANMDAFTKVGDSLAGRYFQFRLHPFDVKESMHVIKDPNPQAIVDRLLNLSGFPEPFLKGSETFYRRWKKTHLDVILRQDFIDLTSIRSIKSIELLVDLLAQRVASPISFSNLAQDLQADHKTIKSWVLLLENFYVLFKISPYHHNIARAILKEPKFYFFDIARVKEIGPRVENLVACALLKEIHYLEDTQGLDLKLHYVRTRDGKEVDFLIVKDDTPIFCCEVKTSDTTPSPSLLLIQKQFNLKKPLQLVLNCIKEFDTQEGIQIRDLAHYLAHFSLMDYL